MSEKHLSIAEENEETESVCSCCGRSIFQGSGLLQWKDTLVADYWYMWPDGHNGMFHVAIRWGEEDSMRIVVVNAKCDPAGTKLSIEEPESNPWPKLEELGSVLTRIEAKNDPDHPEYFDLFDSVIELDSRLSPRVREREINA